MQQKLFTERSRSVLATIAEHPEENQFEYCGELHPTAEGVPIAPSRRRTCPGCNKTFETEEQMETEVLSKSAHAQFSLRHEGQRWHQPPLFPFVACVQLL
mmetsp:Transcript_74679/g.175276  ORF Transcript_74679/g.175276 Transcript_74679/m.175276 type:complete len:100 (-) Transcript_74679:1074-1373(-)